MNTSIRIRDILTDVLWYAWRVAREALEGR